MNDPLVQAFDLERAKDSWAYDANIDFDKRIAKESLNIERMITPDGKLSQDTIRGMKPFTDPSDMYNSMSEQMPMGRGIDQKVFLEKYQGGKALYDMNLANQLNLLRQGGMSESKIDKTFVSQNPEMRRYLVENGLLQPRTKGSGVLAETLKQTAVAGGVYGGIRAGQLYGMTPKVDSDQLRYLRNKGFDFKDGKLKRMSASEIIKANSQNWDDPPDGRPLTKQGKPNKRYKWGYEQKAQTPEWKAEAKKVIDARRQQGLSRTAKVALGKKAGDATRKAATNVVLGNMSRHVGSKIGTGVLARLAGMGLGSLGGPAGAAIGSVLIPAGIQGLMSLIGKDDKDEEVSIWK